MTLKQPVGWIWLYVVFELVIATASAYRLYLGGVLGAAWLTLSALRLYFVFDVTPQSVLFIKLSLVFEALLVLGAGFILTTRQYSPRSFLLDFLQPIVWYVAWHISTTVQNHFASQKYLGKVF